jgi:hypothetical protein
MKSIAVGMLVLCSVGVQAAAPKKEKAVAPARKAAVKPVQKQKPAAPAVVIPPSATRVDENTYTHTDAQGKTWVYRKTPFGIQKTERVAESNPYPLPEVARDRQSPFAAAGTKRGPAPQVEDQVTATESADSITFSKKTPFGANVWTKKKSELNDEEKALLERAKAK